LGHAGACGQDTDVGPETYACDDCGFEHDFASVEDVGPAIVDGVAGIVDTLRSAGPALRRRPQPEVWSALEYGAHLRDVLLVQRERVLAARRVDKPTFDPMGRDERVEHDGYAEQDSEDVVRQLTDAASMFANDLARLTLADWERTVMYSYPKRWERSLRWVAVHTLHEVRHHTLDIERQVANNDRLG
jgi:DinB superfamily